MKRNQNSLFFASGLLLPVLKTSRDRFLPKVKNDERRNRPMSMRNVEDVGFDHLELK